MFLPKNPVEPVRKKFKSYEIDLCAFSKSLAILDSYMGVRSEQKIPQKRITLLEEPRLFEE